MSAARLAAVAVFVLPVLLPLAATLGVTPAALALVLPGAALLCAAAATAAVLTGTPLTGWVVGLAVAINVAAAGALLRRRAPLATGPAAPARWQWLPLVTAGLAAAAVLTPLRRADIGWDTRSIWFLHARLVGDSGATYAHAMGNPAYAFSHVDYPLASPGTAAWLWWVSGSTDYRLGQAVLGLVGASLLVLAGVLLARAAGGPARGAGARGSALVGAVLSAAFVLAGAGVAGRYATNGYADLLAGAAALCAAVALLVLPLTGETLAVGLLTGWLAASTKNEGLVAVLVIAALLCVRTYADRGRRGWRVALGASAALAVPVLAWPAYVAVHGTAGTYYGGHGAIDTPVLTRAHHAVTALAHHLPLVGWALLVVVAATLVWGRARRRAGLGASAWLVLLAGLYLGALVLRYARGPWDIDWWLGGSVDRVTILPRLALLAELVLWLGVASGAARARPPAPTGPTRPKDAHERQPTRA